MESEPGSPAIRAFSGDSNASGSPLLRPTDGDRSKLGHEAPPAKIPLGEREWEVGLGQGLQGWHGLRGRGAGSKVELRPLTSLVRPGLTGGMGGDARVPADVGAWGESNELGHSCPCRE